MKSFFCLIFFSLSLMVSAESKQVLMEIDGELIYAEEFTKSFEKVSKIQSPEKVSAKEYFDLFTISKLKIAEAKQMGIDTLPALIKEWTGYKKQLAQPYMTDQEALNQLAQTIYERMKEDVEVAQILIQVPQNPTPEDTLAAYRKADVALQRVKSGEAFDKVAREISEDPAAKSNNGYIGFITPMLTIFQFEDIAYTTPVGTLSEIFRTPYGYHVIKVISRKPSVGEIRVAHILKAFPQNATQAQKDSLKGVVEAVYNQVISGEAFDQVASKETDDKATVAKGGELPPFGIGRMVKPFESAAFALTTPNEISKPVESQFGYHIIKLIAKEPLQPFSALKDAILSSFQQSGRSRHVQYERIQRLKTEQNFRLNESTKAGMFEIARQNLSDSLTTVEFSKLPQPLFTYAGSGIFVREHVSLFVSNEAFRGGMSVEEYLNRFFDEYINFLVTLAEEETLPTKYPAYRELIKEYKDGLVIFEITNRMVWDKAAKDTLGLKSYFEKNKKEYNWTSPHFKGWIVSCKNDSLRSLAQKLVKSLPSDSVGVVLNRTFNIDKNVVVATKKGLFRKGENTTVDKMIFKVASTVAPEERYPSSFVVGKTLKKGPEVYTDVLGAVISDYQQEIEKEWTEKLRKGHEVKYNDEVLRSVLNQY